MKCEGKGVIIHYIQSIDSCLRADIGQLGSTTTVATSQTVDKTTKMPRQQHIDNITGQHLLSCLILYALLCFALLVCLFSFFSIGLNEIRRVRRKSARRIWYLASQSCSSSPLITVNSSTTLIREETLIYYYQCKGGKGCWMHRWMERKKERQK